MMLLLAITLVFLWPVLALALVPGNTFHRLMEWSQAVFGDVFGTGSLAISSFPLLWSTFTVWFAALIIGSVLSGTVAYILLRWFVYELLLKRGGGLVMLSFARPLYFPHTQKESRFPKWGYRHLCVWFVERINTVFLRLIQHLFPMEAVLAFALRLLRQHVS